MSGDNEDGALSDLEGAPKLYLEFETTHLRFPLDEVFVNGGGSIAGAGARGSTLMMLTGAEHSVKQHLTETPSTVRLEVPDEEWVWEGEEVVGISNRMHLVMCSEINSTPAVNVVLGESISGELSVKVATLFDREMEGEFVPASGAVVSRYGSWMNSDNTYGFRNVRFVSGDGDEFAPHFQDNRKKNMRMDMVSGTTGLLQAKYDHAWKVREAVVLPELKNLTKPVSSVSFGLNGSGYVPSFAVANRKFPHSIDTLEDFLKAAISTDLGNEKQIEAFLAVPFGRKAAEYAGSVVTAISLITNSLMPYRSDGAIITLAGNQIMFKPSELWTNHSTNSPFRTDDCDGSAGKAMGIVLAIKDYASRSNPRAFPFVAASAKALAYYTPAIGILAANAGHADKANSTNANIAGHAVAVLIKTFDLLRGLDETSTSSMRIDGMNANVSSAANDAEKAAKLADVRLKSMYPRTLLATLPEDEAECIQAGWNNVYNSKMFESLPKFLVAEGTSPCASRVYTHDPAERRDRAMESDASNEILKSFSPSVMRAFRWLDSSKTDSHKFYLSFAEMLLPPNTGLYTHSYLRNSGDATAHVVLTKQPVDGVVTEAGATPKQLATGAFSAIPLFTMGEKDGRLFDEAMEENERNTMRAPPGVHRLNDMQSENMRVSIDALKKLREHIPRQPTRSDLIEATWLVSLAALANNPQGIGVFINELANIDGVAGDVDIHPIRGVLAHEKTGEDMGAFVALSLMVPPR